MFDTTVAVVSIEPTSNPASTYATSASLSRPARSFSSSRPSTSVPSSPLSSRASRSAAIHAFSSWPAAMPVLRDRLVIGEIEERLVKHGARDAQEIGLARTAYAEQSRGHVAGHFPRIAVDDVDLSVALGRRGQKLIGFGLEDLPDRCEIRASHRVVDGDTLREQRLPSGPCRG